MLFLHSFNSLIFSCSSSEGDSGDALNLMFKLPINTVDKFDKIEEYFLSNSILFNIIKNITDINNVIINLFKMFLE